MPNQIDNIPQKVVGLIDSTIPRNHIDKNDKLKGGSSDDKIYGLDGPDTLSGGLGDDTIKGGEGDDLIEGIPFIS